MRELVCRGYHVGDLERLAASCEPRDDGRFLELMQAAGRERGWTVVAQEVIAGARMAQSPLACAFVKEVTRTHLNLACAVDPTTTVRDWAKITAMVREKFTLLEAGGVSAITAIVRADRPAHHHYLAKLGFVEDLAGFEPMTGWTTMTRRRA